jgi:hypothetical protein
MAQFSRAITTKTVTRFYVDGAGVTVCPAPDVGWEKN